MGPDDTRAAHGASGAAAARALPRAARALSKPTGGVRLGTRSLFVAADELPAFEAAEIIAYCDQISQGTGSYLALLNLNRARLVDLEALFAASQSPDVNCRWQRLWVLCPTIARLARSREGQQTIQRCLTQDLPALVMFHNFALMKNSAVQRLFARLHDDLLAWVLDLLVQRLQDAAQATLLGAIIASLEKDGAVITRALAARHANADPARLLTHIPLREKPGKSGVSTAVIRDKLTSIAPRTKDSKETAP